VYHSNLALALEELQAPGERAAELEEAISALRRARELRPDESKYAERLNKLERQHRFVMRYGESALKLKPVVRPIEVFLQSDLLPCILSENTDTLSDEMLQLIDEMRNSIRQRFGLTLPGVLFTTIEDETQAQPGAFRFSLMEVPVDYGVVALGKKFALSPLNKLAALEIEGEALSIPLLMSAFYRPLQPRTGVEGYWIVEADWTKAEEHGLELWTATNYLMRRLQAVLEENLAEFVNYQETMNLLTECATEACADITKSPRKLTTLTQVLRELVGRRTPIVAFDTISEQFIQLYEAGTGVAAIIERLRDMSELNER
jgi:flagellar biosynthesis component FlhA